MRRPALFLVGLLAATGAALAMAAPASAAPRHTTVAACHHDCDDDGLYYAHRHDFVGDDSPFGPNEFRNRNSVGLSDVDCGGDNYSTNFLAFDSNNNHCGNIDGSGNGNGNSSVVDTLTGGLGLL